MSTLLVSHTMCLRHDMGDGHPERPDRLRAIDRALEAEAFQMLARDQAPCATLEALQRVHRADYVAAIRNASQKEGRVRIDQDTSISNGTWDAAIRSAGGAVYAIDEVMSRRIDNAFVATRPPGHHAEVSTAMGFCFFNNAAIAARHAQAAHGAERIAIVDFDVHHGNGTQDIFWSDKSVLYVSSHEMPAYPGTGALSERGAHDNIVNAPLRAGDAGDTFREAYESSLLPRIRNFSPDVIVISAGFDAHHRDPLGNLQLREDDFAWITRKLTEISARTCGGRLVSLLEGGYDLDALGSSVAAHVAALMEA